jgi:predicted Zn-dependent protease
MSKSRRILLYSTIGLFLTAAILLSVSKGINTATDATDSKEASINWESFPKRPSAETQQQSPRDYAEQIRIKLLLKEYDLANKLIEEAEKEWPEHPVIGYQKARLSYFLQDYDAAEALVWELIGQDSKDANLWAYAGSILEKNNKPEMANQAIEIALNLDPSLSPHLFPTRWKTAVQNDDTEKLSQLADEFYNLNPDKAESAYYLSQALLHTKQPDIAINLLVNQMQSQEISQAALWFTLGQAYFLRRSYPESVTAFESAQKLYASGDQSLYLLSESPEMLLADHIAKAYFEAGRCASSEALFRRLLDNTDSIEYSTWVTKSVVCQTPTPTPTHWMISLQNGTTPQP